MERYIIAIDQSTSASKAFLIDQQGEILRRFSRNHQQYYPYPGQVEHDGEEIWQNVRAGIMEMAQGLAPEQIAALAISNQRETTVLWERETGKPVCPAVVWQDVRGEGLCGEMKVWEHTVEEKTGLKLSPYYSAAKAASVLKEKPEIARKAREGSLCIGTVDSYLIYRLTDGQSFCTDVSNASRTQLCDIRSLAWDGELCEAFQIPRKALPEILPSDGEFGFTCGEGIPSGVPIIGVMGDSHAALFGQGCLSEGMTKATFGTGSSVMMNVGPRRIASRNGLSSSVGFGFQGKTCYVLEGNVTCSGDTLCWLRDEAGLIDDIGQVEALAAQVESTEGVTLVPAFSGLGAPYFEPGVRAALLGMNRGTTKAHIVRAALESIAYQDADVLHAMAADRGKELTELRVDGGPTRNGLLMQFLSDLLGCPVKCASQSELSALGAAYMAGLKTGMYSAFDAIAAVRKQGVIYQPQKDLEFRRRSLSHWQEAVRRCR